jgi:hypothetical protein
MLREFRVGTNNLIVAKDIPLLKAILNIKEIIDTINYTQTKDKDHTIK